MARISVVITLFNKQLYIKNCLDSVLNQTHSDFEIIVIDDGSTDDSVRRVNEYSDDRITLCRQKNKGVSGARNVGIRKCNSNYIAILDADDEWLPNHLENLLDLIKIYPDAAFWVSGYRKSTEKPSGYKRGNQKFYIQAYLDSTLKNTSIAWTSAVLIRKDRFDRTGGFMENISHGEDKALWIEMCMDGYLGKSFLETAIYNVYDNTLSKKIVLSPEDDACMLLVSKIVSLDKNLSVNVKDKLLETRNRYGLAHAIGALSHGQSAVAKNFIMASKFTRIYRKKRAIISILWLISICSPQVVSYGLHLISKWKKK